MAEPIAPSRSAPTAEVALLAPSDRGGSSYGQILRSSALIGGSTLINVIVGVVRTKIFALLLGPAGVGLMGAYTSVADLMRSVAGMGITQSGVRQIAEATRTNDAYRIARTVTVLRRVAVLLGLIGAALLIVFAVPLAELTFGTSEGYALGMVLLAAVVFLNVVAGGQSALLQGLRRIGDLARLTVVGSVLGSLVAIPFIFGLRNDGVVPAMIATALVSTAISWWYSRKVHIESVQLTVADMRTDTVSLLRLGMAFMVSGLLMMGAAYAVRIIVLRNTGLDSAGLYQAGWTLGGLYVGFILQAMGTDFYPRLVAQANDHEASNRLVNEQARVSILLAGPGVVATLVLSQPLLELFYSSKFVEAVEILRWTCLGMAMRVITWPMGFIIVAKNRQTAFIATEVAWTVVNVGLSWYLVGHYGLAGAGIAFFASYVFHAAMIYPVVRGMTGFGWSKENLKTAGMFLILAGLAMCSLQLLPPWPAYSFGVGLLVISSVTSTRSLLALLDKSDLPKSVVRVLSLLGPRRRGVDSGRE